MGIADTVAPASDQLDAIDLTRPMTFTVTRVDVKENAEQPVTVHLAEFPRPWKPGKNMRRVLIGIWGEDERVYVGRRLTLFNNPKVKWAGKEVGGSRISHASHIDRPVKVKLIASQGQYAEYTVQPLVEDAAPSRDDWEAKIAASHSIEELRGWWQVADPAARNLIEARVADLQATLQDEHRAAADRVEEPKQIALDDEASA